ncbi:hypothetical protein VTJ49DRAFT_2006 [Mycothermus thermophilus]|uniref:Uncharacterized protein n=1 Tax=Humicola insolens TaxID=85995 RepID=A0ABR3VAX9_HUMIN
MAYNPFQPMIKGSSYQTLLEYEQAQRTAQSRANDSEMLSRLSSSPFSSSVAKVSEWVSHQQSYFTNQEHELRGHERRQLSQQNSPQVPNGDMNHAAQWPRYGATQTGQKAKPRDPFSAPSSRSTQTTLYGRKRKAFALDEADEVVFVKEQPCISPRPVRQRDFIDLTLIDDEESKKPHRPSRDENVVIIDPPAKPLRQQLQTLILGHGQNNARQQNPPPQQNARQPKRPRQAAPEPPPGRQHPRGIPSSPGRDHRSRPPPVAVAEEEVVQAALPSIEPQTNFFTLPIEVRDKIYRLLLVSPQPIHVQHLWTKVALRPTPRRLRRGGDNSIDNTTSIDTKILSVCRQTAYEGTRVLYSENLFLYILRDATDVIKTRKTPSPTRKSPRSPVRPHHYEEGTIDLAKYGHLIRHMAIELERNRTTEVYRELMCAALEAPAHLAIHLQTLTITISPCLERGFRSLATGNDGTPDARALTVASFFDRSEGILKALQRIDVDFLRIHVHVNSDARSDNVAGADVEVDSDEEDDHGDDDDGDDEGSAYGSDVVDSEDEEEEEDDDDDHEEEDEEEESDEDDFTNPKEKPKYQHLETTIDLRYLPRHMHTLLSQGPPIGTIFAHDHLIQSRRTHLGTVAFATLTNLRRHIEDACLRPEWALKESIWEEHAAAEQRRKAQKVRSEAKFDADAYDEDSEDEDDEEEDRWLERGGRSLIISIERINGELKAYRL